MFEQTFKNIDSILRRDAGCSTALDYAEQSSWLLFLKWLDDYEVEKKTKAKLENKSFKPLLSKEYQWSSWAIIKTKDDKIDYNKLLVGPDLKNFVDNKLFPYLASFKDNTENLNTLEYKIGEIFSELKNKLQDGYTLRDIVNEIDNLKFRSDEQKHELSALYENRISDMGNSGRNGGEYYTPRPLIKSIVKLIDPKIGEIVYDGAVGSAGFLVEAFEHMKNSKPLNTTELKKLQTQTFYGVEKKSLAYIIGIMNMILHGIESPNITHKNTLEENIQEIQNKDRVDVILANPPFGSQSEQKQIQENFPIVTGETAYMFLQHFIKKLKIGGRAGVIIKNTFLSNGDAKELRKQLITDCNLFAVLDLPKGTFLGAGVKTIVLFFEKGLPTEKIWYYQLNTERNLGKTNPLNENDLKNFLELSKDKKESKNSWFVKIKDVNKEEIDLSVKNPNIKDIVDKRSPAEIITHIEELENESTNLLKKIKEDL